MVEELEKEEVVFNEATAINLLFGLMIVAKDSTSVVASLAIKFIAENPKALAELKVILIDLEGWKFLFSCAYGPGRYVHFNFAERA